MSRRPWLVVCAVVGLSALSLSATALWAVRQALQTHPIATTGAPLAVSDLNAARRLISRDVLREAFHGAPLTLSLSGAQTQALVQDMGTRVLHAPTTLSLAAQQADLMLSLPIQRTPLRPLSRWGAWLNVHARLRAARPGPPELVSIQVGKVSIPPALALWVGRRLAQSHGLLEMADLGLSAVERVQISPVGVSATLRWRPELSAQASALLVPPEMVEALADQHGQLAALLASADPHASSRWDRPLHALLAPLMARAQQRSLAHALTASSPELQAQASRENRAVLLVLGFYVNRVALASLVPAARDWPALPVRPVTLQGREDWAQHYLTSAAMATDLGGRLSDLIGMYKEMLDAAPQGQGSGFSFNDLAADKAGVRLGRLAMHEPLALQERLQRIEADTDILPRITDLPEFLTHAQLQQRYGGIDAPAYQALMRDIDRRIAQTPALR